MITSEGESTDMILTSLYVANVVEADFLFSELVSFVSSLKFLFKSSKTGPS